MSFVSTDGHPLIQSSLGRNSLANTFL